MHHSRASMSALVSSMPSTPRTAARFLHHHDGHANETVLSPRNAEERNSHIRHFR